MDRGDFIDIILALAFILCVIAVIFSGYIQLVGDALETVKLVLFGSVTLFTGKQMPISIGK
jgi:hypothetical protein